MCQVYIKCALWKYREEGAKAGSGSQQWHVRQEKLGLCLTKRIHNLIHFKGRLSSTYKSTRKQKWAWSTGYLWVLGIYGYGHGYNKRSLKGEKLGPDYERSLMPCQSLVLKLQFGDSKQMIHQNYPGNVFNTDSWCQHRYWTVFLGCTQHLYFWAAL